jgi:hypothetical protein
VGEGEATLDNLSALSKVIVAGGGTNTVTIKDAIIIQLIVSKEGTKVRVLSNGDSTIFQSFVFNGNIVVDETEGNTGLGEDGYENIVYIDGTVSSADAVKIANEIASKLDNTGKVTQKQVAEGAAAVLTGVTTTLNPDGSIEIALVVPPTTHNNRNVYTGEDSTTIETQYGTAVLTTIAITDEAYCGHTKAQGGFVKLATITSGASITTAFAISTPAQLQHLAMHLSSIVILTDDISIGATTGIAAGTAMLALSHAAITSGSALRIPSFTAGNFVPIGGYTLYDGITGFTGIFYGNNKIVSGLNISASAIEDVGLFGKTVGATIKDFTISGGAITGSDKVGGVVGDASNTTIAGISNSAKISGVSYVGGVVGCAYPGTVNDCYNTGDVSGSGDFVGGVVGVSNTATIDDSYNTGKVSGSYNGTGGLVGWNSSGTISNSYNTGDVSGKTYAGGIAGINSFGTIDDTYSKGAVSGIESIGGLVGQNRADSKVLDSYNTGAISGSTKIGGSVGENTEVGGSLPSISNSYNTGSVFGTSSVGGVVGSNTGTVSNSSWLVNTNLINSLGIGSGTDTTTTFSAIDGKLSAIYTSMSAIASSASGTTVGAITDIVFSAAVNTTSFSGIQGSYIKSGANVDLTITAISAASITVATAASLNALISPGGTNVQATASSGSASSYSVVGIGGTWVLIKAICSDSSLNRSYTIYFAKVPLTIASICGVTAPVRGATPAAVATETDEYTANISWSGSPVNFAADTTYTAIITITPKSGYTLTGVAENFFTVSGATTNDANTGVVTAVFPKTSKAPISIAAIAGVTAPVRGANPAAIATETDEYTATISWSGSPSTFAADTAYTATITITPKDGYTLTGVAENFFTVAGTSVAATNDANTGVVTAVFPKTSKAPLSAATVTIVLPAAGSTPQTASDIQTATNDANFTITSVTWNQVLTTGGKFKAAQAYTATIVLTSKNLMEFQAAAFTPVVSGSASVGTTTTSGSGIGNTVSFTVTYYATAALSANSIAVKTQPTDMEYAEDDALSLAGLSVTLTYNDGTTEDVAFAGFGPKSITVNFADGLAMLVATHNGNPVIVTCNSHTANTSNLSVTAPAVGICGHLIREGGFTSSTTISISGIDTTQYAIYTAAQLQHLAMHTSASAILMNDIAFGSTTGDVSGTPMGVLSQAAIDCGTDLRIPNFVAGNFVPIGTKASPFTGSFDGNNKSISGLNITASAIDYVGLFAYASGAAIQALTISGISITGSDYVGSVVGIMLEGEVKNIHNTADVTGFGDYVGGIVGYGDSLDISFCENAGAVTGSGNVSWCIGGVIGEANGISMIDYSSNAGAIVGENLVGGIAGSTTNSNIRYANNTGVVTGLQVYNLGDQNIGVGGIVGYTFHGKLSNVYNIGAVSGITNVGGVAGYGDCAYIGAENESCNSHNTGAVSGITNVGGLVGLNYGTVGGSQNVGVVTGTTNVGGIVGNIEVSGAVKNCSWLEGTNLINTLGIGDGTAGETTTFSAIGGNLATIYYNMSYIESPYGETTLSAITAITFNGTVNTASFNSLQGSYITSGADNGFTVTVIPGTALTVTRATSLETLLSPGGTNLQATSSSGNASTFSITGVSGNWIMIKAVNEADPSTNRTYIVYIES